MCNCVDVANKALREKNTQIEPIITFGSKLDCSIGIRTSKVDKSRRGNPVVVMATYCPFCGVSLESGNGQG
jgi:hypothetical protein